MAVTEQTPIGSAVGNGATTAFPYAYYIAAEGDLVVQLDGVTKTLNVDYVVTGAGNQAGGMIVFTVAPANGVTVSHFRDTALSRATDYQDGGDLPARTVNRDFDRLWLALQEIFGGGKGAPTALRVPVGEVVDPLPKASERANMALVFDSTGRPIAAVPVSGSAADVLIQIASTSDASKGDALVGVKQPLAGAIARDQHDKNADFISLTDLAGANPDGATSNATAIASAESVANDIYLPPGSYFAPGSTAFTKRYWGPGSFVYSGIGATVFTGSGLNNLTTSGTFNRPRPMTVWVEIVTVSPAPETWRWSSDGGETWVTQNVEILPDDTEVITPLTVTTSPWPLGQTGVSITFATASGHAPGARWTLTLNPNPKIFDAGAGVSLRGKLFAHCDGNRSWSVGEDNFSSGHSVGFENGGDGIDCLQSLSDGYGNLFSGVRVLQNLKKGFFNQGWGIWALRDLIEGQQNVVSGTYASAYVTEAINTAVYGTDAATCQAEHEDIVAIGTQAAHGDDADRVGKLYRIVAIGTQAAREAKNLEFSTIVGAFARAHGTVGSAETALGYQVLINSIGNANTGAGTNAGVGLFAGDGNSFFGAGAGNDALQKNDANNSMALGRNSYTTADNQIVIGTTLQTETILNGHVHPNLDNSKTCGTAIARWSVVYAATGSINTSDERLKSFSEIEDAERRVAVKCKALIRKYQWIDSQEEKGGSARLHFGVGAQSVAQAFASEGLDAGRYGIFCYDEWEDELLDERLLIVDENGKPMFRKKKVREAGNRYGIRYDELAMFILAAL